MRISKQQWLIAIGWAALLHLLVAALLIWSPTPPATSSKTAAGVTVSLDNMDNTPPPPPSIEDMPIEQLKDNSLEAANTSTPASSTSSAAGSVAAPDAPIEAANPVTPAIGNAPTAPTEAVAAPEANPPEAETETSEAPTVAQAPNVSPGSATGPPAIASALSVTPHQTLSATAPDEQVTARDATRPTDASRHGAYGDRDQATDAYIAKLRAWLGRHKHYPNQARQDRVEGTVKLFLAIDARGKVLESRITASSGSPALDAAARRMLAASRPLPPMPPAAQRDRLELIIPIVFRLH